MRSSDLNIRRHPLNFKLHLNPIQCLVLLISIERMRNSAQLFYAVLLEGNRIESSCVYNPSIILWAIKSMVAYYWPSQPRCGCNNFNVWIHQFRFYFSFLACLFFHLSLLARIQSSLTAPVPNTYFRWFKNLITITEKNLRTDLDRIVACDSVMIELLFGSCQDQLSSLQITKKLIDRFLDFIWFCVCVWVWGGD